MEILGFFILFAILLIGAAEFLEWRSEETATAFRGT